MARNFDAETEYQIDRYLRREMSEQEMADFEQRIQAEPQLVDEMLLRRDIIVGIRAGERSAIRQLLEQTEEKELSKRGSGGWQFRNKRVRNTIIAAILALLALLSGAYWGWSFFF